MDNQMAQDVTPVPAVERERVDCQHCHANVFPKSLRRHQRSGPCQAHQRLQAILDDGWTPMYALGTLHVVRRPLWPGQITGIHAREADTGYVSAGWGRPAHTYKSQFLRTSIVQLYASPLITNAEFTWCLTTPEDDPRFQALWTLAQIGAPAYDEHTI